MVNENKIHARIVEQGFTLSSFAERLGLSRPALRAKMRGESDFRSSEIMTICDILDIPIKDVVTYFFCG